MSADAKVLGIPMDSMGMSMQMSSLEGATPFDRTFIDMMAPHHQGPIRMADAELENGELKDLAKRIVAAQTKEIEEMNEWREDWYGGPSPAGGVPSEAG